MRGGDQVGEKSEAGRDHLNGVKDRGQYGQKCRDQRGNGEGTPATEDEGREEEAECGREHPGEEHHHQCEWKTPSDQPEIAKDDDENRKRRSDKGELAKTEP